MKEYISENTLHPLFCPAQFSEGLKDTSQNRVLPASRPESW